MATTRSSVLLSLMLLLAALLCGPGLAAAPSDDAPAAGGSGLGAPERAQLSAARELPERLHAATVAGTAKPAPALLLQAAPADAAATDLVSAAAPLFLIHCVFLC